MATTHAAPQMGDLVMFEGLRHRITAINDSGDRVEFSSHMTIARTKDNGDVVNVPRFRTVGLLSDLRWSEDLQAWFLWGRLLDKYRGQVGEDQRKIVVALRDRGLIPARANRERGQGPAGGEQQYLFECLFMQGVNWRQELANVAHGEGLSDRARACVDAYNVKFHEKLPYGYASPDADDSWAEEA